MEYRRLGRTGMMVSPLCLGGMMFGEWGADRESSIRIIHRALDAGINFIDTADNYSQGESESIIGEALAQVRREDVILATKVYNKMGDDPNSGGNSRRWIIREVEQSLTRLGTDWIDVYQIHRLDGLTDIEETLGALTTLQQQGKIRAFGSSTFPAHEIMRAQWTAEARNLSRLTTEQPPYSMLVRAIEADVLPVTAEFDMGVLAWSPLAGGWLSGLYRKGSTPPTSSRAGRFPWRYDLSSPDNKPKIEAAEQLAQLAEKANISLIHLALAFVLEHPAVTSAIIGPRTIEQLESQLGAADVKLAPWILDAIDEIVPPGVNLHALDTSFVPPALANKGFRRRG